MSWTKEEQQRWNDSNREKRREYSRRWNANNREKMRRVRHRYYWQNVEYERLKALARIHGCLPELLQQVLERDGHMCQHCWKREDLSFDHVVPVSKCGQTEFWNLQVLCRPCNSSKGNR